jgi:hypothetical protein
VLRLNERKLFFAGSGLYVYTKYIVLQGTTNHPSFMFDGGFYRAMAQYTEGMALPLSTLSAVRTVETASERKIGPFVSGNSGRDQLEEKN